MPVPIQFRLDAHKLEAWAGRIRYEAPEVFDELLERGGDLVAGIMREKVPVRTGFLRESIVIRKGRDAVEVAPTAPCAAFVEFGTGPHLIMPVSANVLAFERGGETIFAKHVHHPGFPGRFFVRATREEALPQVQGLAEELMQVLFGAD
jgi:hypothetical protein